MLTFKKPEPENVEFLLKNNLKGLVSWDSDMTKYND